MTDLTILTPDGVVATEGSVADGRVLIEPRTLRGILGWELKPEGLCRGDVCVPVRDDSAIRVGDHVDLVSTAALLGSTSLLDEDARIIAIAVPADRCRSALTGRRAPDFTQPDLDGALHSLEEFKDRKRLLVAFASW